MSNVRAKHRAALLFAPKDLRIQDVPSQPPFEGQVQIQIEATGLCGMHYYRDGCNGEFLLREPIILGHESAGIIVSIGSSSQTDLKVGDRVAIEPGIPCETCSLCLGGRYNLCPRLKFPSSCKLCPHINGTLQTVFNHPQKWVHKIPDNMSFEEAALCEPLSVALQAIERTGFLKAVENVTVFGAGSVGLLVGAVAAARGAKVSMIDLDKLRLEFAQSFCADKTWKFPRPQGTSYSLDFAQNTASEIARHIAPGDITFECTGAPVCLQTAIYLAKPGSKIGIIGMGTPVQTLPIGSASLREVDLIGVFRYANQYPQAIEMISSGKIDVKGLISARYTLEQTEQAFEALESGKGIKTIVTN